MADRGRRDKVRERDDCVKDCKQCVRVYCACTHFVVCKSVLVPFISMRLRQFSEDVKEEELPITSNKIRLENLFITTG